MVATMRCDHAGKPPRTPYYQRPRHYRLRAAALLVAMVGAAWGFWWLVGRWM